MEKTKLICGTVMSVVAILVVGEMFGKVISRPITVWRVKQSGVNVENLATMFDVFNQRICKIEEKGT